MQTRHIQAPTPDILLARNKSDAVNHASGKHKKRGFPLQLQRKASHFLYMIKDYLFSLQVNPSLVSFTSNPKAARWSRILSLVAQSLLALACMRCSSSMSTALL